MSKDGKFIVHDLSDVDYDEVIGQFVAMDEGVKAEKFDPTDDYKVCERCDVNNGCPFFLGPGETR